ncbi:hypothetical protein Rhe02_64890 [Rhizocola hellebori]|uniref:Uncharacterized protein n=2 Tax=Rhizocola hellebori TaxID=1392758 RepID=A0A8J3QF31_9ACTN|nr:hypothetical protein Rhe02_64890 [Rhizocola hellebori]
MRSTLPELYAAGGSGAFGSVPMDFSAEAEDPDTLWMTISEPIRHRARERSGPILAWWASREKGRSATAVVLGEHGLVTVEPVGEAGKEVYRVSGVNLQPGSFRSFEVTGQSNSEARPATAEAAMPFEGQMELLMRNLPGRAQRHLQAPYHDGSSLVRYGSFYLRWDRPVGTELQVWAYVFGTSRLVFVSGSRFTRHGESETLGTWQLTCRSAAIAS